MEECREIWKPYRGRMDSMHNEDMLRVEFSSREEISFDADKSLIEAEVHCKNQYIEMHSSKHPTNSFC